MKKILSFMMCILLSLLTLCACTEETGKSVKEETTKEVTTKKKAETKIEVYSGSEGEKETETAPVNEESPSADEYKAVYLDIIEEYENTYGKISDTDLYAMTPGLYYANLVDFDKNGVPELVLAYFYRDEYIEMEYVVFRLTDGRVIRVETGELYQTGGVDPSVKLAYSEDCVYLVNGKAQSYSVNDYRRFDGEKFVSEFSYYCENFADEENEIDCELNGEKVLYSELLGEIEEFEKKITETDNFFLCWDVDETKGRLEDTKNALKN